MAKYKRRYKKNSVLLIGIAVTAILIFISIGYALLSDTLYINGTANIKYVEQKLDTITVNKTSDQYLVYQDQKWVTSVAYAFVVKSTQLNNTEEKIEVVGNYRKRAYNAAGRDVSISLNFTNNYSVPITGGQITLLEDSTGYSLTPTITNTVLTNNTGTIIITFHLEGSSYLKSGTIKYKASYNVDGITRYIYLTINITS